MSGPLLATYWKDNRVVYYLSSYHKPEDPNLTTARKNKDGIEVILPVNPTVEDYAKYMGGVDRLDQMSRMNKSKKSLRWYRKIEVKLRQIAIYNAYIIEGTVTNQNVENRRKRDLLSFKLDLAHQLIGTFRQERRAFKRPRSIENAEIERLDETSHYPVPSGSNDTLCAVCNKKHKLYKEAHPGCRMQDNQKKRTKTSMKCEKCNVPLCCNSRNSCFKDYHTRVCYWQ